MKIYKRYGVLVFWAVLLMDLFLLEEGLEQYSQYTIVATSLCLMSIFWVGTRRSKHYSKKLIVYLMLFMFGCASFFVYKFQPHINSYNNFYYIFQSLGFVALGFLFNKVHPLNIKNAGWAILGFAISAIACIVSYKIIKFAYSGNLPYLLLVMMVIVSLLNLLGFNIYPNKQKNKLAVNGFMPGGILLLVAFLVLQGYWFVLQGDDTKMMVTASVLCNGFGLVLITQNLVKYLKG